MLRPRPLRTKVRKKKIKALGPGSFDGGGGKMENVATLECKLLRKKAPIWRKCRSAEARFRESWQRLL
jgi:hypothetical protein